jgi:hypothetical protein
MFKYEEGFLRDVNDRYKATRKGRVLQVLRDLLLREEIIEAIKCAMV